MSDTTITPKTHAGELREAHWKVTGLDCPSCAAGVEKSVCALGCVTNAQLTYASATLDVELGEGVDEAAARREIIAAIRKTGHDVEGEELPPDEGVWASFRQRLPILALWGSGIGVALGLLFENLLSLELAADIAFIVATAVGMIITLPRAINSLKNKNVDMNVLMTIAVVGAIALGEFGEGAMVVFLFALGNRLEARSMQKTRDSIRDLLDLTPQRANVRRGEEMVTVPVEEVKVGDEFTVRPGERVPLDGVIVRGTASMDESPLTGESVPVLKSDEDEVFAGTLSVNGALVVRATAVLEDSTLARIVAMVEEAQAHKAPYETFVDRFSAKYTPIVVSLAALVAVVPPLITLATPLDLGSFAEWVQRALVLLVISCPCALVISTPVSIVSAISRSARNGVLVKGGAFLELAAKTRVIAYDKTGTLTQGRPEVSAIVELADEERDQILIKAAALEAHSTHPLGAPIVELAREHLTNEDGERELPEARDLVETPGKGVEGYVADEHIVVGSPSYARDLLAGAITGEVAQRIAALEDEGNTVLAVLIGGQLGGLVAIADAVRPSAVEIVHTLRTQGIERQVMLTGDNKRAAAHIAALTQVDEYRAHLLPSDKSEIIEALREDSGTLAMVGDGINDAPALAAADIGIAMGGAGSDTAIETADVVLMADDITALPGFFTLGRRTMRIIHQNIALSLVVKIAVLFLAIAGLANLWMAVFADTGVALLVILNGMRLLRRK